MRLLRRHATNALLIGVGSLLALAVANDVAQRITLQQRMRIDRHALIAYVDSHGIDHVDSHDIDHVDSHVIDPKLIDITVHGSRDTVCITTSRHKHHTRACVAVMHTPANAWHVLSGRVRTRPQHRRASHARPAAPDSRRTCLPIPKRRCAARQTD
jgi:hypothetical protein